MLARLQLQRTVTARLGDHGVVDDAALLVSEHAERALAVRDARDVAHHQALQELDCVLALHKQWHALCMLNLEGAPVPKQFRAGNTTCDSGARSTLQSPGALKRGKASALYELSRMLTSDCDLFEICKAQWQVCGRAFSVRPHMCDTSNRDALDLQCSVASTRESLYWMGIDQPANGTILPAYDQLYQTCSACSANAVKRTKLLEASSAPLCDMLNEVRDEKKHSQAGACTAVLNMEVIQRGLQQAGLVRKRARIEQLASDRRYSCPAAACAGQA